jgi:amino acid adenylation domain-containing protein
MQLALLSPALLGPSNGFYVEQLILSIDEKLDITSLQEAWNILHERHDALRISFIWEDQIEPRQIINEIARPIISHLEMSIGDLEHRDALKAFLDEDRLIPISMSCAPLSRLAVLSSGDERHHFVWTFPHAILDGRSISIILEELIVIYDSLCSHTKNTLDIAPLFSEFLRFRSKARDISGEYWRSLLEGFAKLNSFPQDPESNVVSANYLPLEVGLSYTTSECDEIRIAANRLGVTVNDMIQGSWAIVVAAQSSEHDVVYGCIRACRSMGHENLKDSCGVLMNLLPRRSNVDPSSTVQEFVVKMHDQQLSARNHESDALEDITRCSGIKPGEWLFESVLMVDREPVFARASRLLGSRQHTFRLVEKPALAIAVSFTMSPQFSSKLIADPRRISYNGACRILAQLKTTLMDMARRPQARLCELRNLPLCELDEMLIKYNSDDFPINSELCLHHLFEKQVDRNPDNIAVIDANLQLSYRHIECQANKLANRLIGIGVQPGDIVALLLKRSADMVVAILAVLKAGAAYVPIDLKYPVERIRFVIEVTKSSALISSSGIQDSHSYHLNSVLIDRDANTIRKCSSDRPNLAISNVSLSYIIFTSGSTGMPKGVMISHRGAVNTVVDCNNRFSVTGDDRILAISSYTFDLSVYDIFGMLAAGAALVICPQDETRNPEKWAELIFRNKISIWNSVPALAEMLIECQIDGPMILGSLRLVMMSGDTIPISLPAKIRALLPVADQFALGGATEASIWSIIHRIRPNDALRRSIPYGRPMSNQKFYVLDANLRPCPTLATGDLYIGGIGLAIGYWNDKEKTQSSFIQHPVLKERIYRTGDQGRFLPDSVIEFLGRNDGQVKLLGFRIELGEIETAIRRLPWVRECIAAIREEVPGNRYLAAYVSGNPASIHAVQDLAGHCRTCLPSYMVPAVFMALDHFPLSANGKVDRKSLPIPKIIKPEKESVIWSKDETKVADLWEKMLSIRPDHPDRTFFECGGNSLAAVRLIGMVAKVFARRLPPSAIFEYPSVRQFAALIKDVPAAASDKYIVPLQTFGNRPPFFMISEYLDIGRFINKEQPIYGLFVGAPIVTKQPHLNLSDIARICLEEMRIIQPIGPYFIGGHCFGAVVAFQVAMELYSRGEQVAYLGMFDPPAPLAIGPQKENSIYRYLYYIVSLLGRNPLHIPGFIKSKISNRRLLRKARLLGHDPIKAFSSFSPRPVNIDVEMFFAKDSYHRCRPEKDPRLAWSKWCKGLVVHETSGDHITFCRAPAVKDLAELLGNRLEIAQKSSSSLQLAVS